MNGIAYNKRTVIYDEGDYLIILIDDVGNRSTYTFTIDKTAPVGELSGVENGGITKNDVSLNWIESDAVATINGEAYIRNTIISNEGVYKIDLSDEVGNINSYSFTIDRTPAVILGIENNTKTNQSVKLTWSKTNCVAIVQYTPFEENAETIIEDYQKNFYLSNDGKYTVKVKDSVGNENFVYFEIKKTMSPITIHYFEKDEDTSIEIKNNTSYTLYSKFKVSSSDNITFNEEEYISNTEMTELGTYNFNISDEYGNTVSFKVLYTDQINPALVSSTSSIVPNVLLIIIGILALIAIVARIIVSCTKKKRKLKT